MSVWLWVVLISNAVYWSIFFYLLTRRRSNAPALVFGVLHMLFASLIVAAPIRAFFDPNYMGYQIGIIRFEGPWATLPATLFLAWALSSAWIAAARGRGRWMKLIAVGDLLFALNLGGGFLLDLVRGELPATKIQGGEFFTLQGTLVALILLLLFALPFWRVLSGRCAARNQVERHRLTLRTRKKIKETLRKTQKASKVFGSPKAASNSACSGLAGTRH